MSEIDISTLTPAQKRKLLRERRAAKFNTQGDVRIGKIVGTYKEPEKKPEAEEQNVTITATGTDIENASNVNKINGGPGTPTSTSGSAFSSPSDKETSSTTPFTATSLKPHEDDPDDIDISNISHLNNQYQRTQELDELQQLLKNMSSHHEHQQFNSNTVNGALDDTFSNFPLDFSKFQEKFEGMSSSVENQSENIQDKTPYTILLEEWEQKRTFAKWTAVHLVSMTLLTIFSLYSLSLKPSQYQAGRSNGMITVTPYFLSYFATIEIILQTGRFFLLKKSKAHNSIITKVTSFLPLPPKWRNLLLLSVKYIEILKTFLTDLSVIVVIYGLVSWFY